MPARLIREGILTSERVDQLTAEAEVFYRRLLSVVDDFGRYFANPKLLRSACYPLKDTITAESITRWLDECVRAGLLVVYRDDNKDYLEVDRFGQQVRAKTSKYPNPIAPAGNCLATAKQEQTDGEQVPATAHLDVDVDVDVDVDEVGVVDGDGDDISNPNGLLVDSSNAADLQLVPPPDGKPSARPECPHQEIIAIYHEILPTCQAIRDWTPARAQHLRARWNEEPKRQNLDYWKRFFEYVSQSDFLTGRANVGHGRSKPFRASLDWIVKSENFAKIREGRYHPDQEAA